MEGVPERTRDMERGGRKGNRGSEESHFLVLAVTSSFPATWPQITELWLAKAVTRPCGHTAPGEQRHLAPSSQGINSVVRRQYQKTAPPGPSGAIVSRRPQRQMVMPELSSQRHQDSEVRPEPPGFFLSDVRYTVLELIKWSPSH